MSTDEKVKELFRTEGFRWRLEYNVPNDLFEVVGVPPHGPPVVHGMDDTIEGALDGAADGLKHRREST